MTTLPRRCSSCGQGGAHDGGGAEQVDRDDAVPLGGVDVDEAPAAVDAGGGDDGVEAADLVARPRHGGLGGAGVGEVDLDEGVPGVGGLEVEDDGGAACGDDGLGDGGAEAGRAAGDQDGARAGHGVPPVGTGSGSRRASSRVDERPAWYGTATTSPPQPRTSGVSGSSSVA